ncbi:hypothetical protein DSO57_1029646 [Entomophthora muscae]|uniref:Uncharacterized protein n=2 Tax=Entomophthora muscae TaxID=34485 RepID=A0ACC2S3A8_9FUNG|nr:hypothetical protein DSO57_1029646 [Entomophthora muscae]
MASYLDKLNSCIENLKASKNRLQSSIVSLKSANSDLPRTINLINFEKKHELYTEQELETAHLNHLKQLQIEPQKILTIASGLLADFERLNQQALEELSIVLENRRGMTLAVKELQALKRKLAELEGTESLLRDKNEKMIKEIRSMRDNLKQERRYQLDSQGESLDLEVDQLKEKIKELKQQRSLAKEEEISYRTRLGDLIAERDSLKKHRTERVSSSEPVKPQDIMFASKKFENQKKQLQRTLLGRTNSAGLKSLVEDASVEAENLKAQLAKLSSSQEFKKNAQNFSQAVLFKGLSIPYPLSTYMGQIIDFVASDPTKEVNLIALRRVFPRDEKSSKHLMDSLAVLHELKLIQVLEENNGSQADTANSTDMEFSRDLELLIRLTIG